MIELLDDLLSRQHAQTTFCLAVMIDSHGSTPRSAGSRMIVLDSGAIRGTIGGGKLEADVIATARQVILSGKARILDFEFTGADAASLDMICGGSAKILLEAVTTNSASLWEALHAIKARVKSQQDRGWLITEIRPDGEIDHRFVERPSDDPVCSGLINPQDFQTKSPALLEKDGILYFLDPLAPKFNVYIFGAGHVSQSLAAVAQSVGFRTVVLDDRAEFASRARFPNCDEVLVLESIDDIFQQRAFRKHDMLAIVTRGHLQDQVVLEAALKTDAGYIGMIGSKRKRELIYQSLRQNGFNEQQIARVHSPIGLSIGAETPEEIAVSITAELIQQRSVLNIAG